MAKMTKAQTRRRILECVAKLDKVFAAHGSTEYYLSKAERNKVFNMTGELLNLAKKLK